MISAYAGTTSPPLIGSAVAASRSCPIRGIAGPYTPGSRSGSHFSISDSGVIRFTIGAERSIRGTR
jgi:hypothetical protein